MLSPLSVSLVPQGHIHNFKKIKNKNYNYNYNKMISKVNGFPSPKDFDRWTDFVCCLGLAFSFFLSFFFFFFFGVCMNMTHARVALGKGEVGNRLTLK